MKRYLLTLLYTLLIVTNCWCADGDPYLEGNEINVGDLPTAAVSNGDTSHVPTCDNVYDFCEATQAYYNAIGDLPTAAITNGDTTHIGTCDGIYDFCETTQAYYNAYADLPVAAVSDDDATHIPNCDNVFEFCETTQGYYNAVGDLPTAVVSNGDTTHIPTSDNVYDFCETTQAYYNAIGDLPTAAVSNGDTTHVPTCDGVYDFCETTQGYMQDVVDDTTPTLGGDLDKGQMSFVIDLSPTSDHTWIGDEATATAAEDVAFPNLCYLNSSSKFAEADADAAATASNMLAIASTSISTDASGKFILSGSVIRDDSWNWTKGAPIYVSCTKNELTQTKPNGSADIVRIIGYALSDDEIWFEPDCTYIEID